MLAIYSSLRELSNGTHRISVLKTGPASKPVKLLVHGSTGLIGPTTGRAVLL